MSDFFPTQRRYQVRYQAATYTGIRTVWAEDGEEAIAKVKQQIHREMTLPMYYEHYSIEKES